MGSVPLDRPTIGLQANSPLIARSRHEEGMNNIAGEGKGWPVVGLGGRKCWLAATGFRGMTANKLQGRKDMAATGFKGGHAAAPPGLRGWPLSPAGPKPPTAAAPRPPAGMSCFRRLRSASAEASKLVGEPLAALHHMQASSMLIRK
ncbi:unnamed protein product [Urochloa humidicola]